MPKAKKKKGRRKATPAQLRALAKARRARYKKTRHGIARVGKSRRWRKKVVKTVSEAARRAKRKSAKRVAAGKKAARTRKRRKAERSAAEPRRRKGRRHAKTGHRRSEAQASSQGAQGVAPKRRRSKRRKTSALKGVKRKSAKRVAAGRKAAATRRRRKTDSGSRHLPSQVDESRRHRRHRRRRNPLPNPLANPLEGPGEFLMGVCGAVLGFVAAGAADRWASTHALQGTAGSLMDQPPAGAIYNSEAVDLPIWSNYTRLGVAAAAVVAPLVLSEMLHGAPKAFFQIAGFSALARTFGKAAEDFIAKTFPTQPIVQQLYAPEQAAANRLATASGQTLSAAAPNSFAGHPRQLAAPVGRPAQALPAPRPQYAPQPQYQPQPQYAPRHVGDSSGGLPPYNPYSACGDPSDFPVPNPMSMTGMQLSVLPQPPTCDPSNGVVLSPNSPQPPVNCSPQLQNGSMSPQPPQSTQVPQSPPPPLVTGGGNGSGSGGNPLTNGWNQGYYNNPVPVNQNAPLLPQQPPPPSPPPPQPTYIPR